MEIHYDLMTYGIPTNLLPVTSEAKIELDNHRLWLQQRRNQEEACNRNVDSSDSMVTTLVPGPLDILMGRDKVAREHVGNRRLVQMIEENKQAYDDAPSKAEKTLLATQMVHMIKESGGRFLKSEDVGWVEADELAARDKITNAFRSIRKSIVAHRNRKSSFQDNRLAEKRRIDGGGDTITGHVSISPELGNNSMAMIGNRRDGQAWSLVEFNPYQNHAGPKRARSK